MSATRPPGVVSRGLGVLMTTIVAAAGCGVLADPSQPENSSLELTFVGLEQFSTPAPVAQPGGPSLYRVSVDVTLVFRFADGLETLIVEIDGPASGRQVNNEFDLHSLAPAIANQTQGREEVRVPLMVPELGALPFRVTVVDGSGTRSGAVQGSFTVQSDFGANDTNQTQTTVVENATPL